MLQDDLRVLRGDWVERCYTTAVWQLAVLQLPGRLPEAVLRAAGVEDGGTSLGAFGGQQ